MLKAALEELKRNENSIAPTQENCKFDSDEEDLMNLLDEIDSIQPTFKPAPWKPIDAPSVPTLNEVTDLSSDLFEDDISEIKAIASPHFTFSKPQVGLSPFSVPKDISSTTTTTTTLDRLQFPIHPDQFTADSFTRNYSAISNLLNADPSTRVCINEISSFDKTSKLPLICGIITSIEQPTGRDYLLSLSDETGTVLVTMHEHVARSIKKPHYGMMLVIVDVSIYRPSHKSQCIIIVPRNVKQMINNTFLVSA